MRKQTADTTKESFKLQAKHFVIIIIGIIIISIGILAATIYLFLSPDITSGIVFGLAILLLLITPIILAIIFYNKRLKNTEEEKPEKKVITLRSSESG